MSKLMKLLGILGVIILLSVTLAGCFEEKRDLKVTSPLKTYESVVAVEGVVSGLFSAVTVDDVEIEVAEDGTFSTSVELAYGENEIVVIATMEGKNSLTRLIKIIRVVNVEITSPQYTHTVTEDTITVSGIVTDPLATVKVNGIEVEVAEDGTFFADIELDYGENNITVSASVEGMELVKRDLWITRD